MEGLVHAPEINQPGLRWFNVTAPLGLNDLSGRLVILDFWTYCCINCLHVQPILKRVEKEFPEDVIVIGVHSPKFTAEKNPDNVQAAIERLGITHPVIHDPNMVLWRQYAVRAWPTLCLITPDGFVIGNMTGEPDPERLIPGIGTMLKDWRAERKLSPGVLPLTRPPQYSGRFLYPGKIKAMPVGPADKKEVWALADSGHHQIVTLDADGNEVRRFGNGQPRFRDAGAERASFNSPQGLIATQECLYIADTGNHAIRRIDRATGETTTVAGTGMRGTILPAAPAAQASETALASVWDLEIMGNQLFFANAGSHQIGVLDIDARTLNAIAGNGHEGLMDGAGASAHLAQPSGLALDARNKVLYFADSETSSVRALDLGGGTQVKTLIGTGLFDFGHADGSFSEAALQHPLGLAWVQDEAEGGAVVVADSFNNRVCALDVENATLETLDVAAFSCEDGVCAPLFEPAGVADGGDGTLLVSDSNNHRIVRLSPGEKEATVWAF